MDEDEISWEEVTRDLVEDGQAPEYQAARLLRKFMCCDAGQMLVKEALVKPFRLDEQYRKEGYEEAINLLKQVLPKYKETWNPYYVHFEDAIDILESRDPENW